MVTTSGEDSHDMGPVAVYVAENIDQAPADALEQYQGRSNSVNSHKDISWWKAAPLTDYGWNQSLSS